MAIYTTQSIPAATNVAAFAYNSVSAVTLYPSTTANNANVVLNYTPTDLGFPITSGNSAINITTTWGDVVGVIVYNNGTRQATVTSAISGDGPTAGVSAISITQAGFGYRTAPTVTFSAPATGTNTATGTAELNIATGALTGVTVTNAGSGYAIAPTVTISAPPTSNITFVVEGLYNRDQNLVTIGFNNSKAATAVVVTEQGRDNSTVRSRRLHLLGYI